MSNKKRVLLILLFIFVAVLLGFTGISTGFTIIAGYQALVRLGYSPALCILMLIGIIVFGIFLFAWAFWFYKKKKKS